MLTVRQLVFIAVTRLDRGGRCSDSTLNLSRVFLLQSNVPLILLICAAWLRLASAPSWLHRLRRVGLGVRAE